MLRRITGRIQRDLARAAFAAMGVPVAQSALRRLPGFRFNPFDAAFNADPYPTYRQLREHDPVYKTAVGIWLITRYDDAIALLGDERFVHADYRGDARRQASPSRYALSRSGMLAAANPPDHAPLRRIMNEAFSTQFGPGLRVRVEAIAHRLIDGVEGTRRMDLAAEFALALPVSVIGGMFGLSDEERRQCLGWMRGGINSMGLLPTAEEVDRANQSTAVLSDFFGALIRRRKAEPGGDFVSAMVQGQDREPSFTDAQIISNCIFFFGAGYVTTAALIGTLIRTLLAQRQNWERLRADPSLITGAVDESLRYESPLKYYGREASDDVVFAGKRIRRGQRVVVLAGAANRDPGRFPDPDRFDITRRSTHSTTFGHGMHSCLGQSLARLEGQVALEVLLRRLPDLRLTGEPAVWRQNTLFRALDTLPVSW